MSIRSLLVLLALSLSPTPALVAVSALADTAAAEACAAALPPEGKAIYAAAKPNITPDVKIADEVRAATRPLVMNGTMSRSDARPAAEAAGKCLAMILQ